MPRIPADTPRRDATSAEFKAMAHPLRLRILRLCLHETLTNKQLADRLDQDPATVLHHVRTLCSTGFLEPDPPRAGKRGALEKPYRSTGKSWILATPDPGDQLTGVVATIDALRAEVLAAGPSGMRENARLGLQLDDDEAEELATRLQELVQSYATRRPTVGGRRFGLYVTLHQLDRPDDGESSG